MAILNREEFLAAVRNRVGEDTSDESISFVEDMTDTFNALSEGGNTEEWEQRLADNDAAWRKKYMDRFFSGSESENEEEKEDAERPAETFDDLFN